jgi:hypothetical protein
MYIHTRHNHVASHYRLDPDTGSGRSIQALVLSRTLNYLFLLGHGNFSGLEAGFSRLAAVPHPTPARVCQRNTHIEGQRQRRGGVTSQLVLEFSSKLEAGF